MRGMRYAVVIERDGLIQGAIRLHVAGLREDGHSVPEPRSRVEYVDA
jgi:predicted RNase H-like HicB family nuclease